MLRVKVEVENLRKSLIFFFYFKVWTNVDKIVKVYEKYLLFQLLMSYLFQNGEKLWKFGKIRVFS